MGKELMKGIKEMKKVKITVLRKAFYEDFAESYLTDGKEAGACVMLDEGDVFVFDGHAEMPEGFCPWAWIDIYRGVSSLSSGANYEPWVSRAGAHVLCCTDGVRPVTFLLETLDEEVCMD